VTETLSECHAASTATARSHPGAAQAASASPAAPASKAPNSMGIFAITVLNASQGVAINKRSIVAHSRLVQRPVSPIASAPQSAALMAIAARRIFVTEVKL
jgi:hypothetical protein